MSLKAPLMHCQGCSNTGGWFCGQRHSGDQGQQFSGTKESLTALAVPKDKAAHTSIIIICMDFILGQVFKEFTFRNRKKIDIKTMTNA